MPSFETIDVDTTQREKLVATELQYRSEWRQQTMVPQVRVLIVDDRIRSREGLRALLATSPEIEVVGEAANGQDAVRLVDEQQPDVVLMDIRMPGMNGLEATQYIKSRYPQVQVIALTLYTTYRSNALTAGAAAFLVKGVSPEILLETIRTCGTAARGPENCLYEN
jgi:YesN/AraC family two-component response regulator